MLNENLNKKIIEELGIDEENISYYENDIEKISLKIGNYNVLAKNDEIYNRDLNYDIVKTIQGENDIYYIVKFKN